MDIVDSHCHVSPYWYEPVESLLDHMDRAGVSHAVLTCTNFQTSTAYEQECVDRFPGRFSYIANTNSASGTSTEIVHTLKRRGASGLRVKLRGDSPSEETRGLLDAASQADMPVSLLATSGQFGAPSFAQLVASLPALRVTIEHLGTSSDAENETELDRKRVFELAAFEGVHMKFHGLGDFSSRKSNPFASFPFEEPIPPYLEWAYEAFGPRRLLWGSNFPEVSRNEGYANAIRLTQERLAHLPDTEVADIFGGNAHRLFVQRG